MPIEVIALPPDYGRRGKWLSVDIIGHYAVERTIDHSIDCLFFIAAACIKKPNARSGRCFERFNHLLSNCR